MISQNALRTLDEQAAKHAQLSELITRIRITYQEKYDPIGIILIIYIGYGISSPTLCLSTLTIESLRRALT